MIPEIARDTVQMVRTFGKRDCAPLHKGMTSLLQSLVDLPVVVWFKCFQHLSCGWIDRLNAHLAPSSSKSTHDQDFIISHTWIHMCLYLRLSLPFYLEEGPSGTT